MMHRVFLFFAMMFLLSVCLTTHVRAEEKRCYELRRYQLVPGKTEPVLTRFREHIDRLFRRHKIVPLGYWLAKSQDKEKGDIFVYLLSSPNQEQHKKAMQAFSADPEFQAAYQASEKAHGKTVEKIESRFLTLVKGSPLFKPTHATPARIFELRLYTTVSGKRDQFLARWRTSAVSLYRKHGMPTLGTWVSQDEQDTSTVVWMLASSSEAAVQKSKADFHQDPAWIAVQKESEKDGPLTAQVESLLLSPTDFSPQQ